jgi:hypothetical protein
MESELGLRRKVTVRSGGRKLVLVKKPVERGRHVVMKALLWALYLPMYPQLQVEIAIGNKYKPDLVEMGAFGPKFWAEAGRVGNQKLGRILKRFPETHMALAVWGPSTKTLIRRVQHHTGGIKRSAPIDLIGFPEDAGSRFIGDKGSIRIALRDLDWRRLG